MQFKLICCQKSRSYYSIIKSVIYAAPSFHNSKLSILSIKLDSYPLLSIASSVEPIFSADDMDSINPHLQILDDFYRFKSNLDNDNLFWF